MLTRGAQTDVQPAENRGAPAGLTPEAIQFAHRMFDAARRGDAVLLQAVGAGLPANMTNDEGKLLLPMPRRQARRADVAIDQGTPSSCSRRTTGMPSS